MRSIIGQCAECCECPVPTVEWDSRSASKSKCGFPGNTGYPVSRYRSRSWTGSVTSITASAPDCAEESGFCKFDYAGENTYDENCDCSGYITATSSEDSTNCTPGIVTNFACDSAFPWTDGGNVSVTEPSATTKIATFDGVCYDRGAYAEKVTGTVTETKSDEYTTFQLITNTEAALPDWDDDWDDTPGSYRNLTTNELTLSIREAKYRFRFKISKVGSGRCYRIEWVERFTPETGDPVDTEKSFQWDGVTPDGYNPNDSATWPISDEFTISVPDTNGTTTVEDVVSFCRGCDA